MRRLCTICARGGSKGVPGKNIRLLGGKPLIAHSIAQAKSSGLFECIAVSSDDQAILQAARDAGADVLVDRPADLATDTAPKVPVIRHAQDAVEKQHGRYDVFVDLDATAPLRLPEDIAGAIRLLETSGVSSVITGAPSHRSPYFNLVEERTDGSIGLSKVADPPVTRRQDAPRTFDMNASIYVWNANRFRADPRVFYPDTRLYEMPAERSHDIDSELDFRIVEMMAGCAPTPAAQTSNAFDLIGKVAVVTGGAGILGRHFVTALANAGAAVASIDVTAEESSASSAGATHARTLSIACDITDRAAVSAALERIETELGPIDILHNNAATKGKDLAAFFAADEDYALDTWREIMAVNLDAMFLLAQEVGRRMIPRRRGSVIQTASIYGIVGPDPRIYEGSSYLGRQIRNPAVYSASKAGVIGLTRHLATVWAPHGIRVNAITPGGVSSGQNTIFSDKYSARVPLGRMARAEEMTGALVFLASDASSYITGQNIVIDGGLSAW